MQNAKKAMCEHSDHVIKQLQVKQVKKLARHLAMETQQQLITNTDKLSAAPGTEDDIFSR